MRRILTIAVTLLLLAALGTPSASGNGRSDERGEQALRAMTAKYHDEQAAIEDGFVRTDECVPQMGYHYANFDRVDTRLVPGQPEALLYIDGPDGTRVLTAVEYLVIDEDQDLSTDDDRPELFGHPFDGPMPGHEPGMPIHYDLHAWVWQDNPNGTWVPFNPTISCP